MPQKLNSPLDKSPPGIRALRVADLPARPDQGQDWLLGGSLARQKSKMLADSPMPSYYLKKIYIQKDKKFTLTPFVNDSMIPTLPTSLPPR